MSEKQCRDVTMEEAAMDYVQQGYAKKFHDNYSSHYKLIKEYFKEFPNKKVDIGLVHILLND